MRFASCNAARPMLLLAACALTFALAPSLASGQDVRTGLSSKETYVGQPVVMSIQIVNAKSYDLPEPPVISGCDVESNGAPSTSSRISIINGRRRDSHTVTLQYRITPRRAGSFSVGPLELKVDGKTVTTRSLRFVATVSKTGDLLFVQVEGKKKSVFVGQPLDLTLKIWIKPFRVPKQDITLSDADMWRLVAGQTSWGVFQDRMRELVQANQRPSGREVMRNDGKGNDRVYYLYELNTKIYPTHSGSIEADDIQIVVHYPVEIHKSRHPMEDFLGSDSMANSPMLRRMMRDEFFRSPFGSRLRITKVRPVTAKATVDATQILPVPTAGRPADYRGAVGDYRIATSAAPTEVAAGDPITLELGLVGTGPMDRVQAPPLNELPILTDDFYVADRSLAGLVRGETKRFATTIRPRREGITEIPAIPFSFFDPDSRQYRTVYSDPIVIKVDKAESLSLDAIVAGPTNGDRPWVNANEQATGPQPDFQNYDRVPTLLENAQPNEAHWWVAFLVIPPIGYVTSFLFAHRNTLAAWLAEMRPAHLCFEKRLAGVTEPDECVDAMVAYIARKTRSRCDNDSAAIGALRTYGLTQAARDIEDYLQSCQHWSLRGGQREWIERLKENGLAQMHQLEAEFANRRTRRVHQAMDNRKGRLRPTRRGTLALLVCLTWLTHAALATEPTDDGEPPGLGSVSEAPGLNLQDPPSMRPVVDRLTAEQQATLAREATELYREAGKLKSRDAAEARVLFEASAEKYQSIANVTSNPKLFFNLGNAYLQSGDVGRAIANYERAHRLAPEDRRTMKNLQFALSLVKVGESENDSARRDAADEATVSLSGLKQKISLWNHSLIRFLGQRTLTALLATASVLFWGALIAKNHGMLVQASRWCAVPLLILTLTTGSLALHKFGRDQGETAIAVTERLSLRSGDGDEFDILATFEPAIGIPLRVLSRRGGWCQVQGNSGMTGWVRAGEIEQF